MRTTEIWRSDPRKSHAVHAINKHFQFPFTSKLPRVETKGKYWMSNLIVIRYDFKFAQPRKMDSPLNTNGKERTFIFILAHRHTRSFRLSSNPFNSSLRYRQLRNQASALVTLSNHDAVHEHKLIFRSLLSSHSHASRHTIFSVKSENRQKKKWKAAIEAHVMSSSDSLKRYLNYPIVF